MRIQTRSFKNTHLEFVPIDLVVLQATSACNLNCSYCYLPPDSRKRKSQLPLASIREIFAKIFSSRFIGDKLQISWHSGEPLVLSSSYYDSAIQAILDLKEEQGLTKLQVGFNIQTNGTLIDQKWCDFFQARRDLLRVGISCDGPAFLHDAHRVTWTGRPTHEQTCRGMRLLCDQGLDFDLIAVVSAQTLDFPGRFYEFFCRYKDHIREFHFNLLDEFSIDTHDLAGRDAYAAKYYRFLQFLLEAMKRSGASSDLVKLRNFAEFYDHLFAEPEARQKYVARNVSRPFKSLNIDAHGNVSTFYAGLTLDESPSLYGDGRGLMVGNLLAQELEEIASSEKLRRIAEDFETSHRACESACEYCSICSGGYNLVKHRRYGTFEAAETPECFVHVKTFANALLEDLNRHMPNVSQGAE